MTKKEKNKIQTSEKIMTGKIISLVVISILLLSVALLVGVGHEMLEQEEQNANTTLTSLERTEIDSRHDWHILNENSLLNLKTNYVYIYDPTAHDGHTHFYSPQTKQLLHSKLKQIPLFDNLYYNSKFGLLCYVTGTSKGIHYHLWEKINADFLLMIRIIEISILILGITILISLVYVKVIVAQLTQPLNDLTKNANQLIKTNQTEDLLRVPAGSSVEVQNLTSNFNQLLKQLKQQNKRERDFISNATHELKTPIATIKSNVQLIKRRGKEHPEIITKAFNYIDDETRLMQKLIDQLLMISKEGHLQSNQKLINLSDLIRQIKNDIQPTIKQKINLELTDNQNVVADETMLTVIITNLINNAAKYSADDTQIHITLVPYGKQIRLNIADQGMGISEEEKQHIFERFYRGVNVRGTIQGSGLGLSLVAELVKVNNIQVKLADNHPHGTIFSLIFERKSS